MWDFIFQREYLALRVDEQGEAGRLRVGAVVEVSTIFENLRHRYRLFLKFGPNMLCLLLNTPGPNLYTQGGNDSYKYRNELVP